MQENHVCLLLAKIFGGLGCTLALVAALTAIIRIKTLSGSVNGNGTVVDLHRTGRSYRPVIEFTPPGQAPIKFESPIGSKPPLFHKGESVPVRYSPTNPSNVYVDRFWHLWFFPVLFGILATPFLLVSVMMWIWGIKQV